MLDVGMAELRYRRVFPSKLLVIIKKQNPTDVGCWVGWFSSVVEECHEKEEERQNFAANSTNKNPNADKLSWAINSSGMGELRYTGCFFNPPPPLKSLSVGR